jgi:hypothetical protein
LISVMSAALTFCFAGAGFGAGGGGGGVALTGAGGGGVSLIGWSTSFGYLAARAPLRMSGSRISKPSLPTPAT